MFDLAVDDFALAALAWERHGVFSVFVDSRDVEGCAYSVCSVAVDDGVFLCVDCWAVVVCHSLWALHYVFDASYLAAVDYAAGVSVVACAYDGVVFDYYCAEFASEACASFGDA